MRRRWIALFACAALALSAFALKANRYGAMAAADARVHVDVLDRVAALMGGSGWEPGSRIETRRGGLYRHLQFHKSGCATAVVVAVLEGNAESASIFRRDYGDASALLQSGEIIDTPSGMRRQMQGLRHAIERLLTGRTSPQSPVLGLAPAPPAVDGTCRGPSSRHWRGI